MSHVVDKVILHVGELLLTEHYNNRKGESHQHYKRKDKRRDNETHRVKEIVVLCREVYTQCVATTGRVVGEYDLRK